MKTFLVLGAALTLAGCAPMAAEPDPMTAPAADRCNARAHQSLIGTNVAAVSFPAGANVRIVCTTCPTTRDLRPDRLNVRFDQATGIVRSVECG